MTATLATKSRCREIAGDAPMTEIRKRIVTATLPVLLVLGAAAFQPVFADQLTLGGCNSTPAVTVSSGSATTNCTVDYNPSPAGVVTGSFIETGDLSTGTSGLSVTVTNTPIETPFGGSNSASLQVNYVFDGSGVTDGTAVFDLTASGSITSSGGNGEMEFEYSGGPWTVNGNPVSSYENYAFLGNGTSAIVLDAPIVDGTVDLGITEFAEANCPSRGYPLTGCTSTVDFDDPFSITGATVYDSSEDLVPAATLVSESGFNPNATPPVSAPEPSSLLLLP